jgi:hypothetical protein
MKTAVKRAVALAFCLLAFIGLGEARCLSRNEIAAAVAEQLPGAKTALLAGEEAAAFLAAYNAEPPVTALHADEVLLVEIAGETAITRAVLFERGCLVRSGAMPRQLVKSLLSALERSKS